MNTNNSKTTTIPEIQDVATNKGLKRSDYLSWDEYFMSIALLSAMRSKDPSTQVGACITNSANKIVGIGYNGMPNGLCDDEMPWGKHSTNELANKFVYGCTIYTTLFPCNECAKVIIQAGIKKVIYFSDSKAGEVSNTASKFMFDKAGVSYDFVFHSL